MSKKLAFICLSLASGAVLFLSSCAGSVDSHPTYPTYQQPEYEGGCDGPEEEYGC